MPTSEGTNQRHCCLNPNEESIVDLTSHVENDFVQVEHLDVLAETYAKRLIEYQQTLLDCDYIREYMVLDPCKRRYSSAFWNAVNIFVAAIDNEAVDNEDESSNEMPPSLHI